jgi:hypothetical protein
MARVTAVLARRGAQCLLQAEKFLFQLSAGFVAMGVVRNTGHWANGLTLRLIEVPDAFCATVRVDFVDVDPGVNGLVGAHGFAHVAVDTVFRNQQGQG